MDVCPTQSKTVGFSRGNKMVTLFFFFFANLSYKYTKTLGHCHLTVFAFLPSGVVHYLL